jgi:hypothetical protein
MDYIFIVYEIFGLDSAHQFIVARAIYYNIYSIYTHVHALDAGNCRVECSHATAVDDGCVIPAVCAPPPFSNHYNTIVSPF